MHHCGMLKTAFCHAGGKLLVYLVECLPRSCGTSDGVNVFTVPHRIRRGCNISSRPVGRRADCPSVESLQALDDIAKALGSYLGPHKIAEILRVFKKTPTLAVMSPVQLVLKRAKFCKPLSVSEQDHRIAESKRNILFSDPDRDP
jgi:hypothetical protein